MLGFTFSYLFIIIIIFFKFTWFFLFCFLLMGCIWYDFRWYQTGLFFSSQTLTTVFRLGNVTHGFMHCAEFSIRKKHQLCISLSETSGTICYTSTNLPRYFKIHEAVEVYLSLEEQQGKLTHQFRLMIDKPILFMSFTNILFIMVTTKIH